MEEGGKQRVIKVPIAERVDWRAKEFESFRTNYTSPCAFGACMEGRGYTIK
jgi:hypothetical protein